MKKSILLLIACVTLFALAACGSSDKDNQSASKKDTEKTTGLYDKVMDKGVLTVGTEGTYAPFTYHDNSGKLTGYDVEVIREVAKRMGVKAKFQETQWDSMFAGLNAGRFDLVANQVGINQDRLKKYDFSKPYTYSSAVVVVPKDNNKIKSFSDIKGKKSAQSLTSNYGEIAKKNGAELVGVEGLVQSIELIKQGRVDLTVNDKLAILDYMKEKNDKNIKIAAQEDSVSETAFCFNKGNDKLVDEVNKQLDAMRKDGTLAKIAKDWFGEDVSAK
ncbi:amino acid ABC transporter substrate-binding protein [Virgibacillus sp. 179-BFC.A HS]|uniref:Amino acid ABC transporter substrate-binding protein n=1 Tax=Tigheibacillus jepli TaxID=3035914 RepID=A0ABU5CDF2_9BACI|nr:amino acid ABC transporter substrate-binding protein [Virgibacillus sp. 179-BFC.A HS]MDY0404240.1 amino acid ABC transporter substrate-binding protein [Virgibacillus sp. 179-BFC.A HS]